MHFSVVLLLAAALSCCGSSSIPSKYNINEYFRKVDFRRQASDVDQCANDKLEAASFNEVCMISEEELNTVGNDQQSINEIAQVLCRPDCRNLLLRVTEECGGSFPGLREFVSDVCDTKNMDGKPCYSFYNRAVSYFLNTESNCYVNQVLSGTCTCQSELMTEVETQGCCINVYQNYFEAISRNSSTFLYDPKEIYEGCNVDQPEECSSMALVSTLAIIITSFVLHTMIT